MSFAGVIWVRKEEAQCGTIADFPMFPPSRESFRTFHELSEIFSDENNHSLSRELLIKVWGTCSPDKELGLVLAERSPLVPAARQSGHSASPPQKLSLHEGLRAIEWVEKSNGDMFWCT